jgi:voltage-gated potassium channel Kch
MRSFFALVDLVAVLPAILGFFDAADFRVLRLLRLLRMLKLVRHSTTFGLLFAVLREESRSIVALLFVLLLTVVISGSLMYMLESAAQPDVFSSIPAAMWWAIETLATVGYGDMVPMTVAGRIVGGVVSIVGIATLALFRRHDYRRLSRSIETLSRAAFQSSRCQDQRDFGDTEPWGVCRQWEHCQPFARVAARLCRELLSGTMIITSRSRPHDRSAKD